MDPMGVTCAEFDTFRVDECKPVTPLANWKTPKPDASTLAIDSWNRSNKPNAKDFLPPFKDKAFWTQASISLPHWLLKGCPT